MKAIIVPNKDVISKEDLITELATEGQGDISRSITILDDKKPDVIVVELDSRDEFNILLSSPKVAGANSDVYEDTLEFRKDGSTTINPNTTWTVDATHHNWGLAQMSQSNQTLATTFTYQNDGANVDVVIMDTGSTVGHPEFQNQADTATRLQSTHLWTAGQVANYPNHYTDPDGHGTHVTGTVAGRTQGWAREANIYSFATNLGGLTHGYNASDMGYITSWHQSKGTGRPTIVNMSWAVSTYFPPNHPDHFQTTLAWDPAATKVYHQARSSTYDTLVKNMNNAGVVVVCSAGNDNTRIYKTDEIPGWNKGYWYFFDSGNDMGYGVNTKIYKEDATAHDPNVHGTGQRAGTPGVPPGGSYNNTIYFSATNNGQSPSNAWLESGTTTRHDISVMAHDHTLAKASFSNYGEALTVWAPGVAIMSSCIAGGSAVQIGATGFYLNKYQGTSMASPQIAGLVACYLDRDASTYGAVTDKANQETAQAFLLDQGDIDNAIIDWGAGLTNLNRSYQPYQDYTVTWSTGHGVGGTYAIATVDENQNVNYDLSATFRNSASEQLHTVTYGIQSGALPNGVTLSNAGLMQGAPDASTGGSTHTFVVRADNGFEYKDKSYSLTVNDTVTQVTLTGGVIIGAGLSLG